MCRLYIDTNNPQGMQFGRFKNRSIKGLSISMSKIVHAVKGGLLSYCDKVY
jgi:hypothetical protein